MTTVTNEWLRPSALPKLAKCAQYRSEAAAGEAAARGTKLDTVFRALIAKQDVDMGDLTSEDRAAVQWAVDTTHALAGGNIVETNEGDLRVSALGLSGTADGLCPDASWSLDLKTGQKRGYVEQQALYALGFMEDYFAEEWTVYLLYCDLQEVETLRFTKAEAENIVREVLGKVHDNTPPELNEYCGWCARRWECPARQATLDIVSTKQSVVFSIKDATSAQLTEFTLKAGVIEEFNTEVREELKRRCLAGEKIPNVSLISKKGSEKVQPHWIELNLKQLGTGDILAAYGPMSKSKLQPIVDRKMPGTKIPDDQIQQTPGSTYVRVSQPKGEK